MKNLWFIVLIVLMFILNPSVQSKTKSNVFIKSTPYHIDIYINNIRYVTPTNIYLKPGKITVWGAKIHYLSYKRNYIIPKNRPITINVIMKINPVPDPPEGAP